MSDPLDSGKSFSPIGAPAKPVLWGVVGDFPLLQASLLCYNITTMGGLKQTEAWAKLMSHYDSFKDTHIRDLFAEDQDRASWFCLTAGDLYLDFSKNIVNRQTIDLLIALAREREVESKRDAMFAGKKVNTTEDRAALHVALRNPAESHVIADGEDVMPEIKHNLARMGAFSEAIRSGTWLGQTGKPIKNIVSIGIGGSDLGPEMAVEALLAYADRDLTIRFDSNVDEADFHESVVADLNQEETLFIIISKTFTTDETLTNALSARLWIADKLGDEAIDKHFVAVSSDKSKVQSFGISESNIFELWDWVGGRYSLASSVGLSLMISIGKEKFDEFLMGFHDIDEHFRTKPLEENMPVTMALLSIWYNNFFGAQTHAVLPYAYYLSKFPAYLQQTSMESLGKAVTAEGELTDCDTGAIIWGHTGTNAQHSFFQLLHQGTRLIPADFIGFRESNHPRGTHHKKLLANMLAQTEVLAFGRTAQQLHNDEVPENLLLHKAMPGNRPSNIIFSSKLGPRTLGQLVAVYEHKTFVEAAIWGINPFDQYGVETGKEIAKTIYEELKEGTILSSHDKSTVNMINKVIGKEE